jgi:chromosome segregation protein
MKLLQRLRLLASAILTDLFGEDGGAARAFGEGPLLDDRLAQAQAGLDRLRVELAQSEAQQRRAEAELQQAQGDLHALDAQVDEALEAEQDDLAARRLQTLQRRQARVTELERMSQAYGQTVVDLRSEVESLQRTLDDARAQARRLQERQRSAESLEQAALQRRELSRTLERLTEDVRRGEEQAARREDRAAALRELEQRKR